MSQDGFDFGPPPPRREPRRFEPPPWERDQFERRARAQAELEKARLEAEQAARAAEAAAQAPGVGLGVGEKAQPSPPAQPASEERPRAHVNDPAADGARATQAVPPKLAKQPVDDKQVELMMLELKAEEPPALEGAWKVATASGAVVALVGIVIGIWGAAAIARLGQAGLLGGIVLVTFGLAFVGIGGWRVYGALRQRGVL